MTDDINYKNNPLHGLGLKPLLSEMVEHYGFEILFAYLNINCFKTNPSIESSIKFLKKTDWAREKVEAFYLYEFKSLPRASDEQFELPPRDRIIPEGQTPGQPATLSMEDAERLREKRAKRQADRNSGAGKRAGQQRRAPKTDYQKSRSQRPKPDRSESTPSNKADDTTQSGAVDPWAYLKK